MKINLGLHLWFQLWKCFLVFVFRHCLNSSHIYLYVYLKHCQITMIEIYFLAESEKGKNWFKSYLCYKAGHFSFEYFGMLGTFSRNSFLTTTKITMFEFGKLLLDLMWFLVSMMMRLRQGEIHQKASKEELSERYCFKIKEPRR